MNIFMFFLVLFFLKRSFFLIFSRNAIGSISQLAKMGIGHWKILQRMSLKRVKSDVKSGGPSIFSDPLHQCHRSRVGPDLVFLAGCRISSRIIRYALPDIRPNPRIGLSLLNYLTPALKSGSVDNRITG